MMYSVPSTALTLLTLAAYPISFAHRFFVVVFITIVLLFYFDNLITRQLLKIH